MYFILYFISNSVAFESIKYGFHSLSRHEASIKVKNALHVSVCSINNLRPGNGFVMCMPYCYVMNHLGKNVTLVQKCIFPPWYRTVFPASLHRIVGLLRHI